MSCRRRCKKLAGCAAHVPPQGQTGKAELKATRIHNNHTATFASGGMQRKGKKTSFIFNWQVDEWRKSNINMTNGGVWQLLGRQTHTEIQEPKKERGIVNHTYSPLHEAQKWQKPACYIIWSRKPHEKVFVTFGADHQVLTLFFWVVFNRGEMLHLALNQTV